MCDLFLHNDSFWFRPFCDPNGFYSYVEFLFVLKCFSLFILVPLYIISPDYISYYKTGILFIKSFAHIFSIYL